MAANNSFFESTSSGPLREVTVAFLRIPSPHWRGRAARAVRGASVETRESVESAGVRGAPDGYTEPGGD
jgi:hypothetical protein